MNMLKLQIIHIIDKARVGISNEKIPTLGLNIR